MFKNSDTLIFKKLLKPLLDQVSLIVEEKTEMRYELCIDNQDIELSISSTIINNSYSINNNFLIKKAEFSKYISYNMILNKCLFDYFIERIKKHDPNSIHFRFLATELEERRQDQPYKNVSFYKKLSISKSPQDFEFRTQLDVLTLNAINDNNKKSLILKDL